MSAYDKLIKTLNKLGYYPKTHICNSFGFLKYNNASHDYVRIGTLMYGLYVAKNNIDVVDIKLKPVLSLKSHIACIRYVKRGDYVGYGDTLIAKKNMKIAIISIGYADGIPRRLGEKNGMVLLHGIKIPIISRICMDYMFVDASVCKNVKIGDEVTLIGEDNGQIIYAEDIADKLETISNEVVSQIGKRVTRYYI